MNRIFDCKFNEKITLSAQKSHQKSHFRHKNRIKNHTFGRFFGKTSQISANAGSISSKEEGDGKGLYPKDFKFVGWHPHCRCHVETMLKTDEDLEEDTQRILDGEPTSTESVNAVTDTPREFKEFARKFQARNEEREQEGRGPLKTPYFVKDNKGYYNQALDASSLLDANETKRQNTKRISDTKNTPKTFAELSKIVFELHYGDDWVKAYFNEETGGFNVYHMQHQFAKTKAEGAAMSGGEAEKHVGRLLADKGKLVEFLAENGTNTNKPDLRFDGHTWDVKYIPMANDNAIRQYYKDARKANRVIFFSDKNDRTMDVIAAVKRENGRYNSMGRDIAELPDVYVMKPDGQLKLIVKNKGG